MTVDIRPAKDTEMEAYRRVASTALMMSPDFFPQEAIGAVRPEMTLCAFGNLCEGDGKIQGYVIYTIGFRRVPHGQPWQRVEIRDMAWLTPAAYRSLWQHFECMELADAIVATHMPPDDPLPHLLIEPRRLNATVADNLLARIVDLPRAMTARNYHTDGDLFFKLTDDLCPWNEGTWRLTVSGGEAAASKTEKPPEMAMPAGALAMLMFGQISPSQAVRMGAMALLDQKALPKWDQTMQTRFRPFCPDFF